MKKTCTLAVLLGAILSSPAGVVYFELSPSGTDAAVGLSPSNMVPAVTNSTGSGGGISGGVVFDTDRLVLQVAIGYGSAAGFSDLTGTPVAMHLRGPAPAGQNANPLVDLLPYNFSAADPTQGGIIFGNIAFPTNWVSNLLAGLTYVEIATASNPTGEIRGQLIPTVASNSAPELTCPPDSTVECGTATLLTARVSDPDGDALAVVWSVNGSPVQTNNLPAQNPPGVAYVSFLADLPLGTNTVGVTATDSAAQTASCATTVTVVDTIPPVIVSASANPDVLWPPNHKLVKVTVSATVTDACGPTTWKIISVSSNEPIDRKSNGKGNGNGEGNSDGSGNGDGNTTPDWLITGPHTLELRAERSGKGDGRVYSITIQATDAAGNLSATRVVTVSVPHDRG